MVDDPFVLRRVLWLRQFPWLHEAELREVTMLAENLTEVRFAPGAVVAPAHVRPPALHFVIEGELANATRTWGPRNVVGAVEILAHPECEDHVLRHADFVGSTTALLNAAKASKAKTLIVATEPGILHQMKKARPDVTFVDAPGEDESCKCNLCPHMKRNTLEKLYLCLRDLQPRLEMSPTDDVGAVVQAIEGLQAVGDTALHDALVHSLYYFRGVQGQRALVLLSDAWNDQRPGGGWSASLGGIVLGAVLAAAGIVSVPKSPDPPVEPYKEPPKICRPPYVAA